MDRVDNATVQRVWQRVKSPQAPVKAQTSHHGGLEERILEEWQTGQRYAALQAMPEYRNNPALKAMIEQKQNQLACLKGIYRLSANAVSKIPAVPPKSEPAAVLLRRCYTGLMRCGNFYAAASADGEFGCVYSQLATQNRQQCYQILCLLSVERN